MSDPRTELRADCSRCTGLCCVAPAFSRSADFPVDKPAGVACPNLAADFRCSIHADLRGRGFVGCTVFDCLGAGQRVVRAYDGRDRRDDAALREEMFAVFHVVQDLHELRWHLADVLSREAARAVHADARVLDAAVQELLERPPGLLREVDVAGQRRRVDVVLRAASAAVRAGVRPAPAPLGRDLVGRSLRGRSLRGADLRGALLLGADLREADLREADLLGADLRGCDVSGADLSTALFCTQFQVNAARGDAATRLPAVLDRPGHWGPVRPGRAPRSR